MLPGSKTKRFINLHMLEHTVIIHMVRCGGSFTLLLFFFLFIPARSFDFYFCYVQLWCAYCWKFVETLYMYGQDNSFPTKPTRENEKRNRSEKISDCEIFFILLYGYYYVMLTTFFPFSHSLSPPFYI